MYSARLSYWGRKNDGMKNTAQTILQKTLFVVRKNNNVEENYKTKSTYQYATPSFNTFAGRYASLVRRGFGPFQITGTLFVSKLM